MSPAMIDGLNYDPPRTAIYVVAAADSPAHARAQADYVCDGVADNVEIQAAINALPAAAGVIYLCPGTFHIAARLELHSNMQLLGSGMGATTLFAVNGLNTNVVYALNRTALRIADFSVNGNGPNQANDAATGIFFSTCTLSIMDNVQVYDTYRHGMALYVSTDCIIQNCRVSGALGGTTPHGIAIYNGSHRATVKGCWLNSNATHGIVIYQATHGVRILDCVTNSNGSMGVTTSASGGVCNDCSIIGCYSEGNVDEGFRFVQGYGHRIEGCVSTGAGGNGGITLDTTVGATVVNNHCEANEYSGIFAGASSFSSIVGNICRNNNQAGLIDAISRHGICLEPWGGGPVCYNTVVIDNVCHDNQGVKSQNYGILVSAHAHDRYIIKNNMVQGNATGGVRDDGTGLNKVIADNIV